MSSEVYLDAGTTALNIRYMKYTSCWAALLVKDVKRSLFLLSVVLHLGASLGQRRLLQYFINIPYQPFICIDQ